MGSSILTLKDWPLRGNAATCDYARISLTRSDRSAEHETVILSYIGNQFGPKSEEHLVTVHASCQRLAL